MPHRDNGREPHMNSRWNGSLFYKDLIRIPAHLPGSGASGCPSLSVTTLRRDRSAQAGIRIVSCTALQKSAHSMGLPTWAARKQAALQADRSAWTTPEPSR